MFSTSVDGFFPNFLRAQNMVRVIKDKINYIENDLRGNENWFELVGVHVIERSSYRG